MCRIEHNIKLNDAAWNITDGVKKPYSGIATGNDPVAGDFQYSKQVLDFAAAGSFMFKGHEPEAVKIMNWSDIQQQLIVKLTQTYYSFREVYFVTESATTANWTLAIAEKHKAELEIATDAENFGLTDIFGQSSTRVIQSKDIGYCEREDKRRPCFFKAKKLVVQEERLEVFISQLISQKEQQTNWAKDFYKFEYDMPIASNINAGINQSVLDMLRANELNPNTASRYFRWADASLDDIEKLFSRQAS